MGQLASIADVKRLLHRDADDTSIDDALAAALATAEAHIRLYMQQDFTQRARNTFTVYDRPEDCKVPLPVVGSTVNQVRLYRTPSATAYVAKPLVDYEVQHDGLEPPANLTPSIAPNTPGSFAAGTYYWVATAVNPAGETNASYEASLAVGAGQAVTLSIQAYGGEQSFRFYRVTTSGTETSDASCLAGTAQAGSLPVEPGGTGGPLSVSWTDTGAATTAGTAPIENSTSTIPARWVRLHPTVFDIPFEGAVSQHYPDNWSRIEVDYQPPQKVPEQVRDATALTAATIYIRSPISASAFTTETLGGYSYSVRPMRGQSTGSNEIIPEVAKALLRPLKRNRVRTT